MGTYCWFNVCKLHSFYCRYSKRIGKRKSWVVPLQLTIGLLLVMFSSTIQNTLYSESPNVMFLFICFFIFYFLAATQDIAVDGWALTLLSEKNKGWASTCNVVCQTLGMHIAYWFCWFDNFKKYNLSCLEWSKIFIRLER